MATINSKAGLGIEMNRFDERYFLKDKEFNYYSYANIAKRAASKKTDKHQVELPEALRHDPPAEFTKKPSEAVNYFNRDWKTGKWDKSNKKSNE